MLRPIDTQTILQQTQEIANRQQATNNKEQMLQHQFSNILTKQFQQKSEMVNNIPADEKLQNNTQFKRVDDQNSKSKSSKKDKKSKKDNKSNMRNNSNNNSDNKSPSSLNTTRIDVRI